MRAIVLRNGNNAHHYINTICNIHSISGSIAAPIHRTHIQQQLRQSKAFYSRFPKTKSKETQFYVPNRSFSSKTNRTNVSSSISNSGLIGWYLGVLKTRPIVTKSITSALIFAAADFTSQTIVRSSSEPYDYTRTCRMAGYGMIILGPSLHCWYNFVSRILPKRDLITTFMKMLMGQAILGPIANATFFTVNAALQGENGAEIMARLKRDMIPTMINNVIYWPICDFITFRFVPVHLQPLVNNSFAYVWTVYLTYMAGLEKPNTSSDAV